MRLSENSHLYDGLRQVKSPVRFAALGIDHRHIYGMAGKLIAEGAEFVGFWTEGNPQPMAGFTKRFPDVPRAVERAQLLSDPAIPLVLIAAAPDRRAELAIEAMEHGKDVMVDKPGCITAGELERIKATVQSTGRIWSVDFSERFEVPSVIRAGELVKEEAIGEVVHTTGLGPHRLNAHLRPDWFFDPRRYGGIICDIVSHQIDQFLHFTGTDTATIAHAAVGNFANPEYPEFEDFGEVCLHTPRAQGYIRVDWYTPDALPNWGDGRLFLLGTEGYIEIRKYADVSGDGGTDQLILVNGSECRNIDCRDVQLPYFRQFLEDVVARTETAVTQSHTFVVTELALAAQAMAHRRGHLAVELASTGPASTGPASARPGA